jgi:hypothetical protein
MENLEDTTWFAREIAELDEYIISFFHIEIVSIDTTEYGELFIETMSIVLGEVGVEDSSSLFDEKCPLLTVDKLSDILFCLGCRNKREPNWFGFAILVGDDLDTLSVMEDVV